MEQLFVRVRKVTDEGVKCFDKDMNDATEEERDIFYNSISKGQVMYFAEALLEENKLLKGNRKWIK